VVQLKTPSGSIEDIEWFNGGHRVAQLRTSSGSLEDIVWSN